MSTRLVNRHAVAFASLVGIVLSTLTTQAFAASSAAPIANASKSSNVKGAMPLTVKFDASLSSCANGCANFKWNFGDGTTSTGTATVIDHVYTTVGELTATLTVTDKSNGKIHSNTVAVKVVPPESLASYVQTCRADLKFESVPIPNLDCYDGDLFAPNSESGLDPTNDYFGYRKLNDDVDLTFACRWLFGTKKARKTPISVEMLIHNRLNGNTCFFSAKGPLSGEANNPSPLITSPTDPNASRYWDSPATVDAKVRCVGCHISGPYIATPLIAPYLAKYGLLNNGHDTLSNVDEADLALPNQDVKFHVISGKVNGVPGAFSQWDSLKQSYINSSDSSCSFGCHVIGTASPQKNIARLFALGDSTVLADPHFQLKKISDEQAMPPYDDGSDYRWINLDTSADGGETETFSAANAAVTTLVPNLFGSYNPNCPQPNVPNLMEAHVVGSDNTFFVTQPGRYASIPDRLSVFNLEQGLVCLNADQEPGQKCKDYILSYECMDANGTKTWIPSPNRALKTDGDHEERPANVCPAGSTATSIQTSYVEGSNRWASGGIGPNDKLFSFSQYGLTCNNADQPDGQCSNYVVRYSSCAAPPVTVTRKLSNVFVVGKELTAASNSLVKGQAHNNAWATQQWTIEPIKNTEYVRVKNGSVYLNVSSTAESAVVGTASSNSSNNQKWLIEPISGSTNVRLKNVFSGKYLTMADPKNYPSTPDYLPVLSQGLNTSWTSQRWVMQ
jgi:hypothetical protein